MNTKKEAATEEKIQTMYEPVSKVLDPVNNDVNEYDADKLLINIYHADNDNSSIGDGDTIFNFQNPKAILPILLVNIYQNPHYYSLQYSIYEASTTSLLWLFCYQ